MSFRSVYKHTIQTAKYNFPVSSFEDAIDLASTHSRNVVLATLPDIQQSSERKAKLASFAVLG